VTEASAGGSLPPRGANEEALAAFFRELLGLPRVGVRDSFFALGGHSLLAAQLAARVRRDLGIELPPGFLFAHPTIEELAREAGRLRGEPAGAPLPPIVPGPRPALIPLSFPQERVWFLDRLAPGSVAYSFQAEIRLSGPLEPAVLGRALTEVVSRHEILRTRFPEVEGRPVQVIEPPWEVALPVEDLSALPGPARERAAEARIGEEIRRPFALDRLPLIRWRLFRLEPSRHVLLQIEHHLVHDGWSLAVLLGEIAALYAAFAEGRRPSRSRRSSTPTLPSGSAPSSPGRCLSGSSPGGGSGSPAARRSSTCRGTAHARPPRASAAGRSGAASPRRSTAICVKAPGVRGQPSS
jgi:hypothetical protein